MGAVSRFSGMRGISRDYFVLAPPHAEGAVLGYIDDHPIAEYVIDDSGHRYRFAGVAPRNHDGDYDIRSLDYEEWIVEPGLVYRWVG